MKIPLRCGEDTVRQWADYMRAHIDEVSESLRREGVSHEMWFFGAGDPHFVIGVMDVPDAATASAVAAVSELSVDRLHRAFKCHWIRPEIAPVAFDPSDRIPFPECELLFEARAV